MKNLPLTPKAPYESYPQASANTAHTTSIKSRAPWELDIFDCLREPAHCCGALFFPCWNGAQIARALGKSAVVYGMIFGLAFISDLVLSILWLRDSYYSTSGFTFTYYSFSVYLSGFGQIPAAACGLVFVLTLYYLRQELRARDNIPGSFCSDLIAAFCCPCCAMTQMSSHTKIAAKNQDTLPAYHAA
uniref:Uncharacterized protein n=1 Tax=Globisporangium ultimum (strain ATCC 200006 / CBS 805.95 / DAOM BR144) TaxID=431595 RepID=K3X1I6_GLOUD